MLGNGAVNHEVTSYIAATSGFLPGIALLGASCMRRRPRPRPKLNDCVPSPRLPGSAHRHHYDRSLLLLKCCIMRGENNHYIGNDIFIFSPDVCEHGNSYSSRRKSSNCSAFYFSNARRLMAFCVRPSGMVITDIFVSRNH